MADEDSAAAADLEAAINVRDAILFPDLWWGALNDSSSSEKYHWDCNISA